MPSDAGVDCARINEALESGKTPEQVADEMDLRPLRVQHCINHWIRQRKWPGQPELWSTCAVINKAIEEGIATGKTVGRVAAEINVPEDRAERCQECVSEGTRNQVLSTGSGDVDGDGKGDKLAVELQDCDPILVASLTRLGRRQRSFQADVHRHILVLGVRDIDRDGSGEVFIRTDRGSSTVVFTIFRIVRGELVQMTLDGAPVGFGLGGSATHFSSIGCGTGKLVTTSLESSSIHTELDKGKRAVYALEGSRLRLLEKVTHDFGPCTDATKGCPSPKDLRAAGYDIDCDPIPFN